MPNKFIQIGSVAASRITGVFCGSHGLQFLASSDQMAGPSPLSFSSRLKGQRSDGVVYHLTQAGIIFEVSAEALDEIIETCGGAKAARWKDLSPYWLPTADWLYAFHKKYSQYHIDPWQLKYLKDATTQAIAAVAAQRLQQEVRETQELTALQVPVTEETRALLRRVKSFDYNYDYIDETQKSLWWKKKGEELREVLKQWPLLLEKFQQGFK